MNRARWATLALFVFALGAWALIPTYPNYDAYYHLVWGREILDGVKPSFDAYAASTEHPLFVALATVAGSFGEHGDRLLVLVTVLSHVAFIAGVFIFSRTVFDEATAWVAAFLAGSSFALLLYASRAYVDIPFLALVFWAAAIEAQRTEEDDHRRDRWAMALLTTAGLLRPEAWVLAGAFYLWRGWRRFDLLAIAAIAPVLWALVDLVVTGDPLFSLHSTSSLADALGRPQGIRHVPRAFVSFVGGTAREPVALAGLVGMALAYRERKRFPTVTIAFALFAAGAITFIGTGFAGLSILPRYLTVPSVALCVFAAYALTRNRTIFAVAVLAGLVFLVVKVDTLSRLTTELRYNRSIHGDLVETLDQPRVTAGLECGDLTLPNYRLVPESRWHLDLPRDRVVARSDQRRTRGVAIVVTGQEKSIKRYGYADGAPRSTNKPPRGFAGAAGKGPFLAYVRCRVPQPKGR
jgi:hypothetical protein